MIWATLVTIGMVWLGIYMLRRDYGVAVVVWMLVHMITTKLFYSIEPNVESTYLFHPDFFEKLTLLTVIASALAVLALGGMISFYQSRVEHELREYEKEAEDRQFLNKPPSDHTIDHE